MTTVSPFAEFLGQAIYQYEILRPLLPTYGHLIVSALFPIYTGAHASLSRPSSAVKSPKKSKDEAHSEDEEETEGREIIQKMESLEPSDALMFPLMAGLTLGGLYMIIKWLEDPAILNKILSFYFSQMGLFFATAFLKDALIVLRSFIFPSRYKSGGRVWKARQSARLFAIVEDNDPNSQDTPVRKSPLPGFLGLVPLPSPVLNLLWLCRGLAYQKVTLRAQIGGILNAKTRFGVFDIVGGITALCAVAYFAFVTKPWWLTNLLGFSFCYGALQFMSPSTFPTGSLILSSLFLYDIYFVFFTPLMVTVATQLDVPIKLLIPRPPGPDDAPDKFSMSILGLGDIVIPGMLVGLALRYDLFLYYKRKGIHKAKAAGTGVEFIKPQYQHATGGWGERFWTLQKQSDEQILYPPYPDAQSFPKTYFNASLVGYTIGMVTTLLAMQYSNHAQPALLYLVPGVLMSLWGRALVRGELHEMWMFTDSAEDGEEVEHTGDEKMDDKKEYTNKGVRRSLFARIFSGDVKSLSTVLEADGGTRIAAEANTEKNNESPVLSTILKHASEGARKENETSRDPQQGRDDRIDENEKTEKPKEINLISFSISLPGRKLCSPKKDGSGANIVAHQTEAVSSTAQRDGEPPAKKRRSSTKKTS